MPEEEGEKLTTRVTSALFVQNTVTPVMGASLLEKATVCNSGASTAVGAVGAEKVMLLPLVAAKSTLYV